MIGTKLAHYEITSHLGSGGMGDVYQATDSKLGRSVAIKLLPETFAHDTERAARFEREARVLASLNQPNIAAIYGIEQSNDRKFLVMELVEGETLAERIKRGPIPVVESLAIAKQICEALEAAHEKGIIHRDLKPANVKITPEGKVKVLDFGLAKAMETAPANTTLSNSPTLSMAATQAGIILGTAAYMSPEQAKGFIIDARSDLFSFGCVLYEMLTGRQPFQGETSAEVLASILVRETEWNLLPPNLNPRITDLLRRCLEKNPKRRWQATGDLRAELELIARQPQTASMATALTGRRNLWKPAAIAFFLGMTAFAIAVGYLYRKEPDRSLVRFALSLPDKTTLGAGAAAVISPDGRQFAFTARDATGKTQLWLQPIDSLTAKVVPNTDGVGLTNIFWSADSRSIAFLMQGKLKRVDINGGGTQTICDAQGLIGGAWNAEGVIVFAPNPAGPLYRVPATGGKPAEITKLENQSSHRFPRFLPDGHHFIFLAVGAEGSDIFVGDLESTVTKRLFGADTGAVYVDPGVLLFIRQGILLAQGFDPTKLMSIGDPMPVAEPVAYLAGGNQNGLGAFSVSNNGVLTFRAGSGQALENVRLTWVDRTGKEIEQVGKPGPYRGVDLSPDGNRVGVHRHDGTGGDVWVFEAQRPTPLRLTFDPSQENSSPIWSPDGKQIAFASLRGGMWGIYQKTSDGAGSEEMLFQTKGMIMPMSWSPDGQFIAFWQITQQSKVWVLPLKGDKKPQPFLQSMFNESHPQISPDGKWISYMSNESGQQEIYVRPFPSGAGRWQVSTNGGWFSRWRPDGKEIFYLTAVNNGQMMSVEINGGSTFQYGTATELFDSQYLNYTHPGGGIWHTYSVSRDGKRFFIPRPVEALSSDPSATSLTVVLNWTAILKK